MILAAQESISQDGPPTEDDASVMGMTSTSLRWRRRLRNARTKVRRSSLFPRHWQTPEKLSTHRLHEALSSTAVNRSSECLFLSTLPAEIRIKIYEYVFTDPPVLTAPGEFDAEYGSGMSEAQMQDVLPSIAHYPINSLCRIPGRLYARPAVPGSSASSGEASCKASPGVEVTSRSTSSSTEQADDRTIYAPHRLALLKTCRQIYTETISTFYTRPTFLVDSMPILHDLAATILPQRLACIRHLHLHFLLCWPAISTWWHNPRSTPDNAVRWERVWRLLARDVSGLRELGVYVRQFMWDDKPNAATEQRVLEPLLRELKGKRLVKWNLWYRHVRVWDPFGAAYLAASAKAFELSGVECVNPEATRFRAELASAVMCS